MYAYETNPLFDNDFLAVDIGVALEGVRTAVQGLARVETDRQADLQNRILAENDMP